MGVTMVELALINLLYCFDWKLPNAVDINTEEAAGLTISKKNPLFLCVSTILSRHNQIK